MLSILGDEQLEVTSYDETSIAGHIDVKEDGLLFLSIPYAEGWKAVVDGEEAEIVPIQDALMGIRLEKGSHDISLKYTPAGFTLGLAVSGISVFVIIALIVVSEILRKNADKKAAVSAEASGSVIEEVSVSEVLSDNDISKKESENEDE